MSRSKAQAFMPDFLGSMLVFSIILTIFLYSWNTVITNQQQFEPEEEMRQQAYYTATFLVSTPGYPENWNNTTVEIPGFASPDNVIQPDKLREFRKIDYEDQKKLLQAENFELTFQNSTDTLMLDSEPLQFGQTPSDPGTVVVVRRNVLVNRSTGFQEAEMEYLVWR